MRIIVITPATHTSSTGAAQMDIYALFGLLKKMGHEVLLYTIKTSENRTDVLTSLSDRYGIDVRWFEPDMNLKKRFKDMITISPLFFDGASHVFHQLVKDSDFQTYLDEVHPDVVVSFISDSWPLIEYVKSMGIPVVFRSHNYEPEFYWESIDLKQKINPINWLRYIIKTFAEKRAVCLADSIATIPFPKYKKYFDWKDRPLVKSLTLTFLPEKRVKPRVQIKKEPLHIFYLGASYNVSFHLRGVTKLIEEIAPMVDREYVGQFKFHICGAKLPQVLVDQCIGSIVYEGYVPDLEDFLSHMDIGVFPVDSGKSMKGKVFESLVRSFPMVISPNCIGGYNLVDGKEVLMANSTEEFVDKIGSLVSPELRQKLACATWDFSEKHFSEKSLVKTLDEVISIAINK
jgi:glycosyltransferase involved in cell wall biosynthesis